MVRGMLAAGIVLFSLAVPAWAANTSVAILDSEYISGGAAADLTVADWLDATLGDSAARRKELTLVDRQALDKVLAERSLDLAVGKSLLGPLVASGVLICPVIVVDDAGEKATIDVQAVLAQRGTLLAEWSTTAVRTGQTWTMPVAGKALDAFWDELERRRDENLKKPTLDIVRFTLGGKEQRLQWMADELSDALTTGPHFGVVVLVPRQAVNTKEERLLRVAGFTKPATGDATALLPAASDYQITGELNDSGKTGVVFQQTPIALSLTLGRGSERVASTTLSGIVGDFSTLQRQAEQWADAQLAQAMRSPRPALEEPDAQAQAQSELSTARRLAGLDYGRSALEKDRQQRLALAALRACHLDPTNEEAAYLAAFSIEGLYEARGEDETLACKDRVIELGEQYIARFNGGSALHQARVLTAIETAADGAIGIIDPHIRLTEMITSPPDARKYPYEHAFCWAAMEYGVREAADPNWLGSNALRPPPPTFAGNGPSRN
jgi:hypothetical protein